MPLVKIHVPATLSADKVHALADGVHEALVETCGVEPANRFHLISAYSKDCMDIDPHFDPAFAGVNRTPAASIVEILLLTGRSADQKAALYRRITINAANAGFAGDDIMITLSENTLLEWSLGFGRNYFEPQGDNNAALNP